MNPWLDEARSLRFGGVATWTLATLAVIGAHGAGAAYLLRPVPQAQDAAAAPALMLELAPMPEAVNTDQTNIADNLRDAAEVKASEPEPEPIPEELTEDTPPPLPEPLPEPEPVQEYEEPVTEAAVALPKVRPEPRPRPEKAERPEPPKEERREHRKRREPPPSVAQNRAAAEVQKSDRNASQAREGASGAATDPRWVSRLQAHLQRYRSKVRATPDRNAGVVKVRFSIDDSGNVLSVALAQSSGMPELDDNAVATVRRASPVPPPPPGMSRRSFVIPVAFDPRSFR